MSTVDSRCTLEGEALIRRAERQCLVRLLPGHTAVNIEEGGRWCLQFAGPDAIKEALAKLGLKTGGTLWQRAQRLFLTRDTPLAELDRKHFVKGAAPASLLLPEESARQRAAALEAALLEAKVSRTSHPKLVWGHVRLCVRAILLLPKESAHLSSAALKVFP